MNKIFKKTRENKAALAVCLLIFLLMLALSAMCGYITDDFHFRFVWQDFDPAGNERVVSSTADIFESAGNYYMLSGGRVVPHFVTFILCNLNKWVFNVLNAAVFVTLGLLAYRFAFRGRKTEAFPLLMVYGSLFLFLPTFGDDVLWLSGSVNYLWTGTLMLGAVLFCRDHLDDSSKSASVITILLILLSSSTNETTGGVIAVWLFFYLIVERRKPVIRIILCFICCIAGEALVVLAPGNMNRASNIEKQGIFDIERVSSVFSEYINWLARNDMLLLYLVLLLLIITAVRRNFRGLAALVPPVMAGAAGFIALVFIGSFIARPLFFPVVMMTAALWQAVSQLADQPAGDGTNADILAVSVTGSAAFFGIELLGVLALDRFLALVISLAIGAALYLLLSLARRSSEQDTAHILDPIGRLRGALRRHSRIPKAAMALAVTVWLAVNTLQFFGAAEQYRENLSGAFHTYLETGEISEESHRYGARFAPAEYSASTRYVTLWLDECIRHDIQTYEVSRFY